MTDSNDHFHRQLHRMMKDAETELIDLHSGLVRIPSVNWGDGSSARETEVAEYAAAYLEPYGIPCRIVESAPGRGNLLARWNSSNSEDPAGPKLLLMSHSDVVPAGEAGKWRHPPFSAERSEGRIWGRGTNDCKMLVACELFAIAKLAGSGGAKRGELRLAVGADEEAGGKFGFSWLEQHEPDFLRADLAINEGGGAYLGDAPDGERLFLVGAGEKGRYEVIFRAEGPGTHASVPWGRPNPVVRIGELATVLAAWSGEPVLTAPVLPELQSALGTPGELTVLALDGLLGQARKFSGAFYNSLMAQTRVTLVPTMLKAGEKSNAVPTSAELRCDGRILPGQGIEDLKSAIEGILSSFPDVRFTIEETAGSSVSEFPGGLRALFERATRRALSSDGSDTEVGEIKAIPTWCTGFTDSRFARNVGTPTYGFQLVRPEANPDRLGIHCVDESIDEDMLISCALALGHLALEFMACESWPPKG